MDRRTEDCGLRDRCPVERRNPIARCCPCFTHFGICICAGGARKKGFNRESAQGPGKQVAIKTCAFCLHLSANVIARLPSSRIVLCIHVQSAEHLSVTKWVPFFTVTTLPCQPQ